MFDAFTSSSAQENSQQSINISTGISDVPLRSMNISSEFPVTSFTDSMIDLSSKINSGNNFRNNVHPPLRRLSRGAFRETANDSFDRSVR